MEVDKQIEHALQSLETYNKTKPFRLKILRGDQPTMNSVQFVISQILRQPQGDPMQKLMAVYFAKDCIETFNDEFISQFQSTVLPIMEKIAMFDRKNQDQERGKYFFSSEPDEELGRIGNSFFHLVLECLWVWSKWFPIDPELHLMSLYKITVQRLIVQKVKFSKLEYFQIEEVNKYLPEQQVPIKILDEANKLIAKDLLNTGGDGSPTKYLQGKLFVDLRKALAQENPIMFPGDRMKHIIKLMKRERRETLKIKARDSMIVEAKTVNQNQNSFQQSNQNFHHQQADSNGVPKSLQQPKTDIQSTAYQSSNYEQSHIHLKSQIRSLQNEVVQLANENKILKEQNKKKDTELKTVQQLLETQNIVSARLEQDNQTLKQQLLMRTGVPVQSMQFGPGSQISQQINANPNPLISSRFDTRPNPQIRSQIDNFKRNQ